MEEKKLTKKEKDELLHQQIKEELKKEVLAEIEFEKAQQQKRDQNTAKVEKTPTSNSNIPATSMKNYYTMGFWFGLFFSFLGLIYFIAATQSGSYERQTACKGWLKGFYIGLIIAIVIFVIYEVIFSFYPEYFLY